MNATVSHRISEGEARKASRGKSNPWVMAFMGGFVLFVIGLILSSGIVTGAGFVVFVVSFMFLITNSSLYDLRGRISQAWTSSRFR